MARTCYAEKKKTINRAEACGVPTRRIYAFDRFKNSSTLFISFFTVHSAARPSPRDEIGAPRTVSTETLRPTERIHILRIRSSFASAKLETWIVTRTRQQRNNRSEGATIKGEMEERGEISRRKGGERRESWEKAGNGNGEREEEENGISSGTRRSTIVRRDCSLVVNEDKKGGVKKGAKNRDVGSRKGYAKGER